RATSGYKMTPNTNFEPLHATSMIFSRHIAQRPSKCLRNKQKTTAKPRKVFGGPNLKLCSFLFLMFSAVPRCEEDEYCKSAEDDDTGYDIAIVEALFFDDRVQFCLFTVEDCDVFAGRCRSDHVTDQHAAQHL